LIYLLVSDDALFHRMVGQTFLQEQEVWCWAGRRRNGDDWKGPGSAFYGSLDDPQTFAEPAPGSDVLAMVCLRDPAQAHRAVEALSASRDSVKVLVTTANGELDDLVRGNVRKVAWADVVGDQLEVEVARLKTLERVAEVRRILDPAEKIAILLQPDPDPDGIASGLALRAVLKRNRSSAPLVTFGEVTRPENVAMLRLLDLELLVITPEQLASFDAVALVDVQASVFCGRVGRVDVVIDHHPEQRGCPAAFRDIRSSYGATSTILTEYCRAAEIPITQRLATALLYGIKTDTLFLDRKTTKADVLAFAHLFPLANTNLLRRIEKPEVPRSAFNAFSRALRDMDLSDGLACVHLGRVEREDVIPQMAELSLQLEGAEWAVASGLVGGDLVVSVRNAGYQRAAGSVLRTLFGDIGSAGGHQAMGKAVVPLKAFRRKFGSTRSDRIRSVVLDGFRSEIR
jgi:nanoRNase/pAp phosphatase (c-di-AMP/oligoRNAs hydrolase)